MDTKFIKLEEPMAELEAKIEELKFIGDDSTVNISEETNNKSNLKYWKLNSKINCKVVNWKPPAIT